MLDSLASNARSAAAADTHHHCELHGESLLGVEHLHGLDGLHRTRKLPSHFEPIQSRLFVRTPT